jgi:hypothetical protein
LTESGLMERQLGLNLVTEEERVSSVFSFLQPVELASRQVAAVALIVGCGELIQVGNARAVRWQASKEQIAKKAQKLGVSIAANTFLRAMEELESRRVVGVLRNTRPWTYVVSLAALSQLPERVVDPVAELAALPCFGGAPDVDRTAFRSTSVNVGQSHRVREDLTQENPCLIVDRERVPAQTGDVGLTDRLLRPWDRRSGLQDSDLVQAVRSGDLSPVRRLWREAKILEWVPSQPSDDDLLRFLTIVHHCATAKGLNRSRMGALVARVKRGLDVTRIPNGSPGSSEDWASRVMRQYANAVEQTA